MIGVGWVIPCLVGVPMTLIHVVPSSTVTSLLVYGSMGGLVAQSLYHQALTDAELSKMVALASRNVLDSSQSVEDASASTELAEKAASTQTLAVEKEEEAASLRAASESDATAAAEDQAAASSAEGEAAVEEAEAEAAADAAAEATAEAVTEQSEAEAAQAEAATEELTEGAGGFALFVCNALPFMDTLCDTVGVAAEISLDAAAAASEALAVSKSAAAAADVALAAEKTAEAATAQAASSAATEVAAADEAEAAALTEKSEEEASEAAALQEEAESLKAEAEEERAQSTALDERSVIESEQAADDLAASLEAAVQATAHAAYGAGTALVVTAYFGLRVVTGLSMKLVEGLAMASSTATGVAAPVHVVLGSHLGKGATRALWHTSVFLVSLGIVVGNDGSRERESVDATTSRSMAVAAANTTNTDTPSATAAALAKLATTTSNSTVAGHTEWTTYDTEEKGGHILLFALLATILQLSVLALFDIYLTNQHQHRQQPQQKTRQIRRRLGPSFYDFFYYVPLFVMEALMLLMISCNTGSTNTSLFLSLASWSSTVEGRILSALPLLLTAVAVLVWRWKCQSDKGTDFSTTATTRSMGYEQVDQHWDDYYYQEEEETMRGTELCEVKQYYEHDFEYYADHLHGRDLIWKDIHNDQPYNQDEDGDDNDENDENSKNKYQKKSRKRKKTSFRQAIREIQSLIRCQSRKHHSVVQHGEKTFLLVEDHYLSPPSCVSVGGTVATMGSVSSKEFQKDTLPLKGNDIFTNASDSGARVSSRALSRGTFYNDEGDLDDTLEKPAILWGWCHMTLCWDAVKSCLRHTWLLLRAFGRGLERLADTVMQLLDDLDLPVAILVVTFVVTLLTKFVVGRAVFTAALHEVHRIIGSTKMIIGATIVGVGLLGWMYVLHRHNHHHDRLRRERRRQPQI